METLRIFCLNLNNVIGTRTAMLFYLRCFLDAHISVPAENCLCNTSSRANEGDFYCRDSDHTFFDGRWVDRMQHVTSASRTTWMIHTVRGRSAHVHRCFTDLWGFQGKATAVEAEMQVVSKMVVPHLLHLMQLNWFMHFRMTGQIWYVQKSQF